MVFLKVLIFIQNPLGLFSSIIYEAEKYCIIGAKFENTFSCIHESFCFGNRIPKFPRAKSRGRGSIEKRFI